MKKSKNFLLSSICLVSLILSTNAAAHSCCDSHDTSTKHSIYLGIEGGASYPIKNTFKKKIDVPDVGKVESKGKLNSSAMHGALIGYEFYPGIAVEFSFQRKPKYKLNIALPESIIDLAPGTKRFIRAASSNVHVTSDLYLLGIVYDLQKIKEFTPYIGVEFGVANIKAKNTKFSSNIDAVVGGVPYMSYPNQEVMVIKKSSSISPAFQLSVGVNTPEILPNLSMYVAGRMQVIYNAKLKYDLVFNGKVTKSDKLKQSIAVGEVVVGLAYDLPF